MNPLVVLGATGSIGRQTLEVADRLGLEVVAVAARRASSELLEIARARPDARVGIAGPTPSERSELEADLGGRVVFGPEGLVELASIPGATVVNGTVGVAGLPASVAALEAGNRLALANKESLVAGGPVVLRSLAEGGGELIPVDSEHSAIHQCLAGERSESVARIILSASGGPFRGMGASELEAVTVDDALEHPTWRMGPRITIDSATLMNKAFEVIETHHLFGIGYDAIDVVVHPQSIVHSLVEFVDGSIKAHLGAPDMRLPIQYAITHPQRMEGVMDPFPLAGTELTFELPDTEVFACLELGYAAGRAGGSVPAVLNAADEVAVQAFLERRVGLSSIPVIVEATMADVDHRELSSVQDVLEVDREARAVAHGHIGASC
ncbi:MAG: 1-deoxy-D-xylulose-5-phosphate reductoisomerase [Acidimicrobiia bacterium]